MDEDSKPTYRKPNGKFDRDAYHKAYMREYMKRYRARLRADKGRHKDNEEQDQ